MRYRPLKSGILAWATAGLLAGAAFVALQGYARRAEAIASALPTFSMPSDRTYLTARQREATRRDPHWPGEVRSLIKIDRKLDYGEWMWNERGIPVGPIAVRVDLTRQIVSVLRGGHEIGIAVILYGGDGYDTPVGTFTILAKAANYRSRTYDAPMPYALRLTADGVAIHGSDVRAGHATHGCVGVPIDFARALFASVGLGQHVLIIGSQD